MSDTLDPPSSPTELSEDEAMTPRKTDTGKPANRQAAMIARLREAGGDRVSFNLPADVLAILDVIAEETGATRTNILIQLIRRAPRTYPSMRRLIEDSVKN